MRYVRISLFHLIVFRFLFRTFSLRLDFSVDAMHICLGRTVQLLRFVGISHRETVDFIHTHTHTSILAHISIRGICCCLETRSPFISTIYAFAMQWRPFIHLLYHFWWRPFAILSFNITFYPVYGGTYTYTSVFGGINGLAVGRCDICVYECGTRTIIMMAVAMAMAMATTIWMVENGQKRNMSIALQLPLWCARSRNTYVSSYGLCATTVI